MQIQENSSKCLQAINHNLKRDYTLQSLPERPADPWPEAAQQLHADWWKARIARQQEIDGAIAAKAEFEYLYDKPYEDKKKVRVAGPFTVESLSPHRVMAVDENDELIDGLAEPQSDYGKERDFNQMILENLKTSGVQQAHKEDKITFTSLVPWPGELICAEGRFRQYEKELQDKTNERFFISCNPVNPVEKRAAIFIGPEFGTVSPPRSGRRRPRSGGCRFRLTHRLRLQLRCPFLRVRQTRPHSRTQGPHERRSAHGRRPKKHRQGQFVRHFRRAGH